MAKNKFDFGTDFQELILQYTVTDTQGFKILPLYDEEYFTLIYHSLIAHALKKYYKKEKYIPEETLFREFIRTLYKEDKIFNTSLTEGDRQTISTIITKLYSKPVSDPEFIVEKCVSFARYVRFKAELEKIDIDDFDSYDKQIEKLNAANRIGLDLTKNYGTFLVAGMPDRAYKRNMTHMVNPTPFVQMNRLLNSGGLQRGNVICLLGKEKRFKTGFLINTCRGYMRMRKKGFYVDLENGEMAITTRGEQSASNQSQETITSEIWDEKLLKMFRKYKRIGAELVIKRFPALSTTTTDIQKWLDELKRDFGIVFDYGIIDYGVLMASKSGKMDEFGRISDAFLDIKNLAEDNKLECIWTAAHITREGDKRTKSKYESTDIAKCIDIPRHVDALLGLQENEDELEQGVMRLEVIEQRNGMRAGNALFWVDIEKQRMREFNKTEIKAYREQAGESETGTKKKATKKSDL